MQTNHALDQSNFCLTGYASLMERLRSKGYCFRSFPEASQCLANGEQFVLLRHDIDFDLSAAEQMSAVEAELGIVSTYFFMLRTEHYNPLTRSSSELISKILSRGHHFGLHFDCASYSPSASVSDLASACGVEAEVLGRWFRCPVKIVSYHRPNSNVLTGNPAISAPLPHTYSQLYTKEIQYCSDSRGAWNHGMPTDLPAFKEGRPLHILVHPIWWASTVRTPKERLLELIESKGKDLHQSFANNCTVFTI